MNDLEHDSGKIFKMHVNAAIESGLQQSKPKTQIVKIPSTAAPPKRGAEIFEEAVQKLKQAKNRKEKRQIIKQLNSMGSSQWGMSALYAQDRKRAMREEERKKARYQKKGNKVFTQETGKWVNKKEYQSTLRRNQEIPLREKNKKQNQGTRVLTLKQKLHSLNDKEAVGTFEKETNIRKLKHKEMTRFHQRQNQVKLPVSKPQMRAIKSYSNDPQHQKEIVHLLRTQQSKKEEAVLGEVREAERKRKSPSIPDLATALYSIEQDKKQRRLKLSPRNGRNIMEKQGLPKLSLTSDEMNEIIDTGAIQRITPKQYKEAKLSNLKRFGELQELPRSFDAKWPIEDKAQNFVFTKAQVFDNMPQKAQLNQKLQRLKELSSKDKHKLMGAHAYNQNLEEIPYERDKNIKRIEQFKYVTDKSAAKSADELTKPRGRISLQKHKKQLQERMNLSLPET